MNLTITLIKFNPGKEWLAWVSREYQSESRAPVPGAIWLWTTFHLQREDPCGAKYM